MTTDKRARMPKRSSAWTVALLLMVTMVVMPVPASASHPEASLAPSNFEIDEDANLKLDDPPPSIDWGSVVESRQADLPTGKDDNSYKGGVKEDTACPDETTGSIPNNKSDLLTFHVYEEPGTGSHPGFLNLAWSRVSDPSGTTLMDFEFNQSTTPCDVGPNVQRTTGDLLIEYAIDQGGARAAITGRFWNGTAWGDPIALDTGTGCGGGPCAVGTINSSVIPASEADGLGEKQPRTFGEAQIDLRLIFDDQSCVSFGSAMLKSRSSDSFTSQLKDFISPIPIDLQNCGNVIIRKQTVPDEDPNTTEFGFTKAFATDPASSNTFTLTDDGVQDYMDSVLFGSGYTVEETSLPTGWDFDSVDCSASTGVTAVIDGKKVTFDIDSDTDVLDCTYYNLARASLTFVKDAERGGTDFDYTTSGGLDPSTFTLADGENQGYSDLSPGTYGATETEPPGWNLQSRNCDNGDTADSVTLAAGDDVTCTFVNVIERGAIEIVKTRKHAANGGAGDPHAGVTFTITNATNGTNVEVVTDSNGEACVDGLPVSVLDGDYTVTETVPSGYVADGDTSKAVTVSESSCAGGDGVTVTFTNTPLTDVTVSIDSLIEGGTASTIVCTDADGNVYNGSTGANGDGSLLVEDLLPTDPTVTLTCEITIDP